MSYLPQKVSREKDLCSIGDESWSGILEHSLGAYPQEACGILLCPGEEPGNITDVYPTRNATSGDPASTYLVEPLEFLHVLKWAEQRRIEVCGFYHSHPDHPAVPSKYDAQHAWEGYLYLILSFKKGVFAGNGAWRWDPGKKLFQEVILLRHPHRTSDETISPL